MDFKASVILASSPLQKPSEIMCAGGREGQTHGPNAEGLEYSSFQYFQEEHITDE